MNGHAIILCVPFAVFALLHKKLSHFSYKFRHCSSTHSTAYKQKTADHLVHGSVTKQALTYMILLYTTAEKRSGKVLERNTTQCLYRELSVYCTLIYSFPFHVLCVCCSRGVWEILLLFKTLFSHNVCVYFSTFSNLFLSAFHFSGMLE